MNKSVASKQPEREAMPSQEVSKKLPTPERFAALSRVGVALLSELSEERLLHLIAEAACEITGATFAAFTLRPISETGQPLVPSEGSFFYLAAIVGVTKEQETFFRHMSLGGEGLLAPIFRHGVSVRVDDVYTHRDLNNHKQIKGQERTAAQDLASAYAQGKIPASQLHSMGVPRGHPIMRSFLGAPLLDRDRQVRGGLLLGHALAGQFTAEDELLLTGLASQAAVALENGRLYRTAQIQAQELQVIFDSSADGITLVDSAGQIVRENRAAQRLHQQLQQEADGTGALEQLLFTPARLTLQAQTEQQYSVSLQQDGETHDYLVTASPLRPLPDAGTLQLGKQTPPKNITGAVVAWHEVTEIRRLLSIQRKQAETEGRLAQLQLILDELPSSVYLVHGPDARLVLANRATAEIWGAQWRPGQPLQDFLEQQHIRIFAPDGNPLPFERMATVRAIQHGETVYHHQQVIRQPDGSNLPVLVNAVALDLRNLGLTVPSGSLHTSDQPSWAALVVHQDVSALKEAEQLKDDFIGIAAHELRTPLAVLKGFAQTLIVQTARQQGPELADWQMEALESIDQATIRLVELTDDLLDVSRLQAGRLTLHPTYFDLVSLTQRVLTRFQMTTERHHLALQTDAEYLVVHADQVRMEQVLSNLLSNAIKYSPEGGPIQLRLTCDDANTILSIQDSGIGIPQEQQVYIFGRFARAENARTYGIKGTGLGLYLCRELVEQLGGHIWFESADGKGTTFYLSLPSIVEDTEDEL
jgi:signal transduction histidine kinase/GAF domain-containing protein